LLFVGGGLKKRGTGRDTRSVRGVSGKGLLGGKAAVFEHTDRALQSEVNKKCGYQGAKGEKKGIGGKR